MRTWRIVLNAREYYRPALFPLPSSLACASRRCSEAESGANSSVYCRFVFDNYTWSRGEADYSLYNLKPIPSRIPLSALIRG